MALKERLTTVPFLAYPDFSISFALYTNASRNGIGFNLTQIEHGRERSVVYDGLNFSDTKKTKSVTEKEALSVVVAIQKSRPYLLDNHFTVVMDHQFLK